MSEPWTAERDRLRAHKRWEQRRDDMLAISRRFYEAHTEHARAKSHEWKCRNRDKVNAWHTVYRAVKSGRLVRPSVCERCGDIPEPTRDGRTRIQAHHEDYSKPLEVTWLCQICHKRGHRRS